MNEKRPQYPPGWDNPSIREAVTAFIIELHDMTPFDGPSIPQWVFERVRELNLAARARELTEAAEIIAARNKAQAIAASGSAPGGSPKDSAQVIPFRHPQRGPLPPAAARTEQAQDTGKPQAKEAHQ